MISFRKILTYVSLFLTLSVDLFAATPLSVHRNWTIFKTNDGSDLCYAISLPTNKSGTYKKRGEPYFTVIRKIGSNNDEISLSSGFIYDENKDIEISINKRKFPLFSDLEKAWTYDKNDDIEIIKLMRFGTEMNVKGFSKGGSMADDTYSLVGFSEAHDKMIELCKK